MLIWLNFYCHIWSQNVPKVKWGENRKKKVFCTKMRIAILISKRFPPLQSTSILKFSPTTYKQLNPLTVGEIPLQWGNPLTVGDFSD